MNYLVAVNQNLMLMVLETDQIETIFIFVGFEVLRVTVINVAILWNIVPFSPYVN
jgi:hypothetical protein